MARDKRKHYVIDGVISRSKREGTSFGLKLTEKFYDKVVRDYDKEPSEVLLDRVYNEVDAYCAQK
ncbi:MAG: hypothetical protein LBK50_01410 [Candidatus Nomurabacteria bacterium]|nr:hypothetical protein [Candidatus Nomurabacteria bacterium]